MERKVGEVFNDGNDLIEVVISENGSCIGCHYWDSPCEDRDECRKGLRSDSNSVIFKKIGESKMDKQEELKRILAEEEQRAKDSLANIEKMKKQLEELNKKDEQPTVSATGVVLQKSERNIFIVQGSNTISSETLSYFDYSEKCFDINNTFETKQQAEQEALRREGQEFIRRCAMLWNKDHDWRKKKLIAQYCIDFDTEYNKLGTAVHSDYAYCQILFDTRELAEKCIKELKAKYNDDQIKVIFGVK